MRSVCIFLTLLVTKVIYERTFSKLKLIITRLRSNLNQENLESLLLMSVKKELLYEIDVSEVVNYLKELSTIMHEMLNL
jgi:DNA polymerase I-like protein with 3'-5' exonuclease and polymerase domains